MLINLPKLVRNSFGLSKTTRFICKTKYCAFSSNAPAFQNFADVISQRQSEANRSIVVQVASEKSFDDVHRYCAQFGNITNAYFYSVPKNGSFILLEYADENSMDEAFKSSAFPELSSGAIPVKSSFLWLMANKQKLKPVQNAVPLNTMEKPAESKTDELANHLLRATTISDQISILYENTRLNNLSVRLRFLGALQIQRALSGLFLNHIVLPFGSTVNGFGKLGCDLDMILHYNTDDISFQSPSEYSSRRLMFHTKGAKSDSDASKRAVVENHIKMYGTLCESIIPGACKVVSIHKARVPIVRYSHKYLGIDVDMSLLNMTGFYISELFHIFGEIDKRVRPLVFVVRRWGQEIQLTSKTRTNSITNFQLTCLVLSFLQQLPDPILPTVADVVAKAQKTDVRLSDDNRSYTFLRDINEIQFKSKNTSSLEELFIQFLEHCGTFDFTNHLISLKSRKPIQKIEHSALKIANPFELEQNWIRNVSLDECTAFKMHAQDTFADLFDITSVGKEKSPRWGLLSIFPHMK